MQKEYVWSGQEEQVRPKIYCVLPIKLDPLIRRTEKPTIKLCTLFRSVNTPLKGTDSKAGTLIHEATHFNYGAETRDFKYGQAECHDLAMDNPYRSAINADNYQYFSENDPYRE